MKRLFWVMSCGVSVTGLAGGAVSGTLGGDQDQNTIGVFAAGDVHLTSTFDVNLGIP